MSVPPTRWNCCVSASSPAKNPPSSSQRPAAARPARGRSTGKASLSPIRGVSHPAPTRPYPTACETTRVPGFISRSCGRSCWLRVRQEIERHDRRPREILLEDVALDDRDLAGDAGALRAAPRERRKVAVVLDAHRRRAELLRRDDGQPPVAGAEIVDDVGLVVFAICSIRSDHARPAWAATSRPCPAGAAAAGRARRRIAGNPARLAHAEQRDGQAATGNARGRRQVTGAHRAVMPSSVPSSARRTARTSAQRKAPRIAPISAPGARRAQAPGRRGRGISARGPHRSSAARGCRSRARRTCAAAGHPCSTMVTSADASPMAASTVARMRSRSAITSARATIVVGELGLAGLAEQDAGGASRDRR